MSDFLIKLSRLVNEPTAKTNAVAIGLIFLFNIAGAALVLFTGGTKFSYVHIMYAPIILCGSFFGPVSGIIGGVISGLLVGPYMPESVANHTLQSTHTWLFRMGFFAGVGAFAGFFSNLSKAYMHTLEKQLFTDPVTDLPNYQGLMRRLEHVDLGMGEITGAIVIKLKQIGDIDKAFGPELTEKMLKRLAHQLNQKLAENGIVGRLEEGKFVILVLKNHTLNDAIRDCYRALNQEHNIDGIPVFVEFFYGVAAYEKGDNLNDVLRKAGNAVDRSLDTNVIESYYDKELDQQAEKNIVILRELKAALKGEGLSLLYQPKVDFKTGKAVGFEALSRWVHPKLGLVPTYQYITLAEKTSLISPYTSWVLQTAIKQLAYWQEQGHRITVAVNFSMANFIDEDLIAEMFKLLKKYRVPSELLEIEVTESALAANLKKVADVLRRLQDHNIKIAVDDFGTGLSSLKYLFELPVNILKVDLLFVQAMLANPGADAIVRNTINLAHELNFKVVAEGVETQAQYDHLTKLGCDVAQGYLIAKPLPVEAADEWLVNNRRLTGRQQIGEHL
jgi:EAL domain-containing protein (putative c-di-GMP-specific phosphodiesterase class I)/GGDEF domain-containing protein